MLDYKNMSLKKILQTKDSEELEKELNRRIYEKQSKYSSAELDITKPDILWYLLLDLIKWSSEGSDGEGIVLVFDNHDNDFGIKAVYDKFLEEWDIINWRSKIEIAIAITWLECVEERKK